VVFYLDVGIGVDGGEDVGGIGGIAVEEVSFSEEEGGLDGLVKVLVEISGIKAGDAIHTTEVELTGAAFMEGDSIEFIVCDTVIIGEVSEFACSGLKLNQAIVGAYPEETVIIGEYCVEVIAGEAVC